MALSYFSFHLLTYAAFDKYHTFVTRHFYHYLPHALHFMLNRSVGRHLPLLAPPPPLKASRFLASNYYD